MAEPNVCVLCAPGTNCDVETGHAFELAGARAERVHLFRLLENPGILDSFQILCIPGGFSYGDDLGAGVVFSQQLRYRLRETLQDFLEKDRLVLGICNGFQVLLKAGILPGGNTSVDRHETTLTWNDNGRYTALWVHLKVASEHNVFLNGLDHLEFPIAHAEGRFVISTPEVLSSLESSGQIACRYALPPGQTAESQSGILPYPYNPNGSAGNVAGLSDATGRVLGLMPHPERYLHATQHPTWTRRKEQPVPDGRRLFDNAVAYFRD
jgi:phosphoribosylformylglycinamidine synthase